MEKCFVTHVCVSSIAVSIHPTCFLVVVVHGDGPSLRRLPVLQTVVDVGCLPAGILPVLDVLMQVKQQGSVSHVGSTGGTGQVMGLCGI